MRRREFIAGLGGAAVFPAAARAQPASPQVVGFLSSSSSQARRTSTTAFLRGLAESGFVDGRNVAIEYRWADERYERLPDLAAELVRRRVDVIASPSIAAAALAAKAATKEIPIVFLTGADPVEIGLVSSLNRPGGNLTGVAILNGELVAKRVELLHEVLPAAKSIAYLGNPTNPTYTKSESSAAVTATRLLGVTLLTLNASTPSEVEAAFEDLSRQRADAILLSGDPFFSLSQREQIIALAARHRIPTVYDRTESATAGGLISYGVDVLDAVRQVGVYTARILKGEKPADLPIQQSVKIELAINLKTAKALGLTIPETLLATADEVIQ
jgi:putative tryptophan/tyrosine transport system substrate-binding protein